MKIFSEMDLQTICNGVNLAYPEFKLLNTMSNLEDDGVNKAETLNSMLLHITDVRDRIQKDLEVECVQPIEIKYKENKVSFLNNIITVLNNKLVTNSPSKKMSGEYRYSTDMFEGIKLDEPQLFLIEGLNARLSEANEPTDVHSSLCMIVDNATATKEVLGHLSEMTQDNLIFKNDIKFLERVKELTKQFLNDVEKTIED